MQIIGCIIHLKYYGYHVERVFKIKAKVKGK